MAKGNIMRFIKQCYKKLKGANYKRNKGIAVLWAAFTLLLLILFMGLAIDGGVLFFSAHQLQNAADAAALAGARIVRVDQAESRVQAQYIGGLNYCLGDFVQLDLNGDNVPDGDIVVGRFYFDERGFVCLQDLPEDVPPDALMVIAKRTADEHGAVPLYFGPIVNVNTADVSRVAIAQALGGWGAGIIALDCHADPGLLISGTATIVDVTGGAIQVNSDATYPDGEALRTNGDPTIIAPSEINVNGDFWKQLPDELLEYVNTGAPQMPDPLCPDSECDGSVSGSDCLPEPSFGPPIQQETVVIEPNETRILQPGYYPGGLEITTSTGTALLEPGIYILDGVGLNINGGNLIGDGVMFYITGTGSVDLRGNGTVQINQNFEIESGPYTGIAIFQDRNNPNPAYILGTNNLDITGVIYFPQNHVEIGGTGDGFGTQLIADTIEIRGTGLIQINYDGRNPFPANRAILVY